MKSIAESWLGDVQLPPLYTLAKSTLPLTLGQSIIFPLNVHDNTQYLPFAIKTPTLTMSARCQFTPLQCATFNSCVVVFCGTICCFVFSVDPKGE